MPNLDNEPAAPVCQEPEPWTPMQPPATSSSGPTCDPGPNRSEWRGTAVEAVEESSRRFAGTPTGFVSGDAAGDRSARAVPAESLVRTMRSVSAQLGDAGAIYTVRDDGSIHNTVTDRTEYVPVCLGPPVAPAAPAPAGPPAPPAASAPAVAAPAAPAPAAPAAQPQPQPAESHWWTRPLGAVKMVGGALETVAGGALVAGGVATSEVGVGVPVAIGGGVVVAHGLDTTISGARTLWYGREFDSFTSQGLQAAGMNRGTANLVDAGIGVVGSLGAGAGARALTASGEVGAVSVAFRTGTPVGHNVVGVTTEAGTEWSHLVVQGARTSELSSGVEVLREGQAVVTAARAPSAAYTVVTVPVGAARANAALEVMSAARGPAGAYSYLGNNCATYAADVMRAGGVATPWFTTPSANLASAALRSPVFVGPLSTTAAVVDATTGTATLVTAPPQQDAGGIPGAR
jgi:hypothetical protein